MKLRPVLLLTGAIGSVPEVSVAYISSVLPTQPLTSDLIMDPSTPAFVGTHLKVVSALRLHKLGTIHSSSVVRHLGAIDATHFGVVGDKLRTLLGLVPASPAESPGA